VRDPAVAEESNVEPGGRFRHGKADSQRGHRAGSSHVLHSVLPTAA
jgi:hypothetical protein